jgi:hypothetical protein
MPRAKKNEKHLELDGLTLDDWRKDSQLLRWSQTNRVFRLLTTVLIKERKRAHVEEPGISENRRLGRIEGYEMVINVLGDMANGLKVTEKADETMSYNSAEFED